MQRKHEINFNSKKKYLYIKLVELVVLAITGLVLGSFLYEYPDNDSFIFFLIFMIFIMLFITYALPLLILYFNYLKHSKGVVLVYDAKEKMFYYTSKHSETSFSLSEIKEVHFYLTPAGYKETFDLSYFRDYRYYEIVLFNEERIFISCLTCDKLERYLPKNVIHRKKKFLPLIRP